MYAYTIDYTGGVYRVLNGFGEPLHISKHQRDTLEFYNARMLSLTTMINLPKVKPNVQSFYGLYFVARSEYIYTAYEIISPLFDNQHEAELFLASCMCRCGYELGEHYVEQIPTCTDCVRELSHT